MISNIIDGLAILRTYQTEPPIVSQAYMLSIPKIAFGSATNGTDHDDLLALGWLEHPVYACYYYPCQTITELADITGEGADDPPPFPVILPPPPPE